MKRAEKHKHDYKKLLCLYPEKWARYSISKLIYSIKFYIVKEIIFNKGNNGLEPLTFSV